MLILRTHFLVAKSICSFFFEWLLVFVSFKNFTNTITRIS